MIKINDDNLLKNFGNQVITKINSIIITTNVGNIIIAPCKEATVSLTKTETFGLPDCLTEKKVTIEAQYDNMIIVK